MKRILFSLLLCFGLTTGWSQAPYQFNFQAVARSASGNPMTNTTVDFRLSIVQGTPGGMAVYTETQTTQTNNFGLANLVVGTGVTTLGDLSELDWTNGPYFLRIELADNGGNYLLVGNSPLMSVPYALHAKTSEQALSAGPTTLQEAYDGDNTIVTDEEPVIIGGNAGFLSTGTFGEGNIPIEGDGVRMMWYPRKAAFRVGRQSFSTAWDDANIGFNSFASGLNNRASGSASTALGAFTTALGESSTAMGNSTMASGESSTATGFNTTASGYASTAMGSNNTASGASSTAMGFATSASGTGSTSMGLNTTASGYASTAMGVLTMAPSYAETVIGSFNTLYTPASATTMNENDRLFVVGNGTEFNNRSNALVILKNGRTGVGNSSPQDLLHIGTGTGATMRIGSNETIEDAGVFLLDFNATLRPQTNNSRSLGNSEKRWSAVFATNGTINTSDARDKNDIAELTYGMDAIRKLRPVTYRWNDPNLGRDKKIGLIAQELLAVIPEVVMTEELVADDETSAPTWRSANRLGVYYSDLIPVLVKGLQEVDQKIEATDAAGLQIRVKELEEANNMLQAQYANVQAENAAIRAQFNTILDRLNAVEREARP